MSWNDDTVSIPKYPPPLVDTEYLYGEERDKQAGDGENPRLANSDVRFRDVPLERDSDDEDICTTPGCTLHKHPDYIPHSFEQKNTRRRSTRNNNPNYIELVVEDVDHQAFSCLLYTSPSPRDLSTSRMPYSA